MSEMHLSCKKRIEWFLDNYSEYAPKSFDNKIHVLDVGGGDINGMYEYDEKIYKVDSMNIEPLKGVDIVVKDPYKWEEIENDSYDVVISLNTFQHIEFFWKTVEEIQRVLKPKGFFAMIAPSQRYDGKYPVACYSFNEDGLIAIAKQGNFHVINATVAGIPNNNTTEDWDYPLDDAFLIAINSDGNENVNYPILNVCRRFRENI